MENRRCIGSFILVPRVAIRSTVSKLQCMENVSLVGVIARDRKLQAANKARALNKCKENLPVVPKRRIYVALILLTGPPHHRCLSSYVGSMVELA